MNKTHLDIKYLKMHLIILNKLMPLTQHFEGRELLKFDMDQKKISLASIQSINTIK